MSHHHWHGGCTGSPQLVGHPWPGSNDFMGAPSNAITIQCHQVVLVVELVALSGRKAMRSDTEPGITRWPFIYGVPSHYNNHHFLHWSNDTVWYCTNLFPLPGFMVCNLQTSSHDKHKIIPVERLKDLL